MTGQADTLKNRAREIRKRILRMHRIGPNVGSAMSAADLVAVLYFDVMNVDAPDDPGRDRFILSKGHAASALYAALALKGFIDEALLDTYLGDGTALSGHPVKGSIPGIEFSTGSLGHGLPVGAGLALSAGKDGRGWRTFVLMGDGECQEGSVWEGAMVAARLGLSNLIAVVDANGLQGYERTDSILPRRSIAAAFEAFGWGVVEVDGHDTAALCRAFHGMPIKEGLPTAVIAHTIKGKGVSEMEDKLGWHYYSVPGDRLPEFLDEVEGEE